jgi:D-arabinose 1-dehydrogenase-like Zn-dependent alcohol dehydrogenase
VSTAALNEAHYRQLAVSGAYGCAKRHMRDALDFIAGNGAFIETLVEDVIALDDVPAVLDDVLSGNSYRYIVKMEGAI